jgi:hypothetical protein
MILPLTGVLSELSGVLSEIRIDAARGEIKGQKKNFDPSSLSLEAG